MFRHSPQSSMLSPCRLTHIGVRGLTWTVKCEILFKLTLLSPLTEAAQSDQAAPFHVNLDLGRLHDDIRVCACIFLCVCVHLCFIVSLLHLHTCLTINAHCALTHISSLFSVADSSQFLCQIKLLVIPGTINVSVY